MAHQIHLENGVILETFAKMLVINEKDEALILTISEYKAHPEKSFTPDLPGGMVEIADGEMEKMGAIRETEEESGIVLDPKNVHLGYVSTRFMTEENKSVNGFVYTARLDHTPNVRISWEHSAYEWVPINELLSTKQFREFLKESIGFIIDNKLF